MIEPSLALQIAVRNVLVNNQTIIGLVDPVNIRSGSTRPDRLPCIILANGMSRFLGHAAGGQYLAASFIDLHIWALEDGADTAQNIGFAVMQALREAPVAPVGISFTFDQFTIGAIRWMRDPDPVTAYTHGVLNVESTIRWSL